MRVWWDEFLQPTRDVFAHDQGNCPVLLLMREWFQPFWLESLGQQQSELPEPFPVLLNLGHSESEGCWSASYLRVSNSSYGKRRIRIPMPTLLFLKVVSVVPLHVRAGSDLPSKLHLFSEAAALRCLNSKSLFCQWDLLQCGVMFRASQGGQPVCIT